MIAIVALRALAIDVVRAVLHLHLRELRQRDALARRRQQADILNRMRIPAIRLQVAHDDVVARLALQHRADGLAADGRLDGVLHVLHVQPEPRRRLPVDLEVQVRLADDAKQLQVLEAADALHGVDDLQRPSGRAS